jgi:RHS repeat-associated protein
MQNTATQLLAPIKPKTVSGVVKIVTVSHRGFAANDPIVHRGCSECSYDVASDEIDYNYFRYYDPSTGRYTQSDPIGLGGGINTYAYVGNNPLIYTDPYGLVRWGDLGSATLGLVGNGAGVLVGGALLAAPEPTVTKVVGGVVMVKSLTGWGLNSYNFGRAWSDDDSYDAPSSAGRAIATAIDPCDKGLQRYADAAELGIDLLSGRLPVGTIGVGGSALDKAANFSEYHDYMKGASFGSSGTTNFVNTMQGAQTIQYGTDAYR